MLVANNISVRFGSHVRHVGTMLRQATDEEKWTVLLNVLPETRVRSILLYSSAVKAEAVMFIAFVCWMVETRTNQVQFALVNMKCSTVIRDCKEMFRAGEACMAK